MELTLTKHSPFEVRVRIRVVQRANAIQISILEGEVEFPASAKFHGRLHGMQAYLFGPTTDHGKERVALAFSSQIRFDRVMVPGFKFKLPAASLLIPISGDRGQRIASSYVALGFTYKTGRTLGQETFLATPESIFKVILPSPTLAR